MHIPPGIDHPAITKAAEHHARLVRERDAARAEARQAERSRPQAVENDQEAYARALEAGKKDPGEKHTEAADEAIRQGKRKAEALNRAVADAEAAVHKALADNSEELNAQLANRLTNADRSFIEAVDRMEKAAYEVTAVRSALHFVAHGGDLSRPSPMVGGFVPGLRVRQKGAGEPAAGFADVCRAMREVIDPPEDNRSQPAKVAGSNAAFFGVDPNGDE